MSYALTIGGSDSSGGAGIQADLTTFQENQTNGATVITCITAQNSHVVKEVLPLPSHIIASQIDAVFEALPIKAVKIGMLYDADTIRIIAEKLRQWHPAYVVLDPVMIASSGYTLLDKEAVETLCRELFPLATVVTPNLHEAEALLNRACIDFIASGESLLRYGSQAVLIKGGHHKKQKGWDCLITKEGEPLWLKQSTIHTKEVHGTGCRLSSAIASFLAKGFTLRDAVFHGKSYVHRFIQR